MNEQTNNFSIPIAIIIAGGLIAGGVYFSGKTPDTPNVTDTGTTTNNLHIEVSPVSDQDHIVGSPDANVVMIEFSDTECPFCKRFHKTMNSIMASVDTNQVAWVYRHMPIEQLHSKAPHEAAAAECVAELGGENTFWTFLNRVYQETPSNNGLDSSLLSQFAEDAGIDRGSFEECLSSGRTQPAVESDYQDGYTAMKGKVGTPFTAFVTKDGRTVGMSGAYPEPAVRGIITLLLAGKDEDVAYGVIDMVQNGAQQEQIDQYVADNL